MVGKQKEHPVATPQNQTRIRPPTTTASVVYQTPISLLLYRIQPHRCANWPMYCVLVIHVGACLPTIWYVPVHFLLYLRGIDPSERSHRAAYCLQRRCLVGLCVVFTNAASQPSERWRRGCLAKPLIKSFNYIIAPVCVRWHPSVRGHPSVRWHRGAQKNTRKKHFFKKS